jgi:DNA helicase-2/ATP-dependent DNA helicase PcrA
LLGDLTRTDLGDKLLGDTGARRAPDPGEVVIATLHGSKGAEYDAVWIPNLGYGLGAGKSFFPWEPQEVWLRDERAVIAERLARGDSAGPGVLEAYRRECIAERLRLLYVGITRARRRITLSCHSQGRLPAAPAHVLALARERGT